MSNLTTFYVVRHATSEWNEKGIIQGHKNPQLSKSGIEEAKILAKKLKVIKFDFVFSSDLLRAKKTAEIIALEHKLEVQTTKLLRERHFGEFEGRPNTEYAVVNETLRKLTLEERYSFKTHGIESDKEIVERLITFLREVAISNPGKKILVVTHGGIIRTSLVKFGFGNYDNLRPGAVKNGAFVKLQTDGVDFFIKEVSGVQMTN
ncbi:MAG: hypothetical protein ACD_37C00433G0001 [uncultured bacterium]|nr:MAG: hypothetical protein ACD_37C00433G0001 [uncultured bacterium]